MKAAVKPRMNSCVKNVSNSFFVNVKTMAPIIVGMARRKESSAARFLSIPRRMRNAMVRPEREIPGMTANPWSSPSAIASGQENSFVFLGLNFSAISINNPVRMRVSATVFVERKFSK